MIKAMADEKRNMIAVAAALAALVVSWWSAGSIWMFIVVILLGYLAGFARFPIADRE